MVSWRTVSLIFLREVRDQFRDRRTLFMIAVLPVLLYPALGLGMLQLAVLFREQPRTVAVLGAENLPAEPALLDGGHFAERWFRRPTDPDSQAAVAAAAKLDVISDALPPSGQSNASETAKVGKKFDSARLLEPARAIREILHPHDESSLDTSEQVRKERAQRAGELLGRSSMQAVLIIPPDFRQRLAEIREQLAQKQEGAGVWADYARPEIVFNKADDKSQLTYSRVVNALDRWEAAILEDWLSAARINQNITRPVMAKAVDVAQAGQVAANNWSKFFPAFLIILTLTGAFHPAVDLVAGEKERGTMETLLICPATRTEIVLGKFFTVMLFSSATALLNLASVGLTLKQSLGVNPAGALPGTHDLSLPSFAALGWIVLLLIPLASLFSALCLALATFARSSKEGQYYLAPLLMVTLGLMMFCLSPTVELTPQYSVLPVIGTALLLKGLLLSPMHVGGPYIYIVPVLFTSFGYSVLALWWAIDQFKREEVLFREGERFELRLWVRHLLRDREPLPSFSEALFCFVLIMLLQFFAMGYMPNLIGPGADSASMLKLLLAQQLAIIAGPPIAMGLLLTTSIRDTFRIRWPGWKLLAAACLLPVLIHPLSVEAQASLHWFFGELPPEITKPLAAMADDKLPLWFVLLAAAAAPAVCEEVAFRGFILSGLVRRKRIVLAIVLSSAAFGIMHMIPQQVFNASLVGLVIGCLAVRSNSLLPCVIFHFVNNALAVCHGRFGQGLANWFSVDRFCTVVDGSLRYRAPTLIICVGLAAPILVWLFRPLFARPAETAPHCETDITRSSTDNAERFVAVNVDMARHDQ
jgi:sodium transport system permease protein